MDRTDIEYIFHCVKNASELINQGEIEKTKGLLLSAELLLSEKITSDNSGYTVQPTASPKFPSLDDVKEKFIMSAISGRDVEKVYYIIKKLGNFT